LVWAYAPQDRGGQPAPMTLEELPSATEESKALSRELKRRGFTFTGPVTAYSTMQSCGIVDDHLAGCFRRDAYR
jgi:DNA-3-methyladenine glycosylase I